MNSRARSRLHWLAAPLLAVLLCTVAVAGIEVVEFSQPQLRDRYQALIAELRCPKCQNQNLADSNAPISVDMRAQVRSMLEAGRSDAQIKQNLVDRYSEFVLYRPTLNLATALLWGLPPLLLLIGVGLLVAIRRRSSVPTAERSTADSAARVAELLAEQGRPTNAAGDQGEQQ